MIKYSLFVAAALCVASLVAAPGVSAVDLKPSTLEQEMHKLKFEGVTAALMSSDQVFAGLEDEGMDDPVAQNQSGKTFKRKSPLKAFLLSAAVPGAGQFYNGSRIKPLVFLGAEVASVLMHLGKTTDADDATDAYKLFNATHWSRVTYEEVYLNRAYNVVDDDSLSGNGITHHLPDELTQQYYEMTGKYNQFAWGWDDATRAGKNLEEFWDSCVAVSDPTLLRITSDETAPSSANRTTYEGMRKHANDLYNTADTWFYVTIANHLISGVEAYISAKRHNREGAESDLEFARVNMDVSLKSYSRLHDTPYVKLSLRF